MSTSWDESVRILGLAGSARRQSLNRALLDAAVELAPAGVEVAVCLGLEDLPSYDEDVEAQGDPPVVAALKASVESADALLIVTPEYNGGVPALLKNAIDWVSRRATRLKDMPAALMSASSGPFGGLRAQLQLRQTLTGL